MIRLTHRLARLAALGFAMVGRLGLRWGWAWGAIWLAGLLACLAWNGASLSRWSGDRDQGYLWGWDNNGYFAWGRSLALDGDIDFANDFAFVACLRGFGPTREAYARYLAAAPRTATGRVPNKYGIGLGVLALPALLGARTLATLQALRTGQVVSPFAMVYPLALIFTSILCAFLGLAVAYRILCGRHGVGRAAGAVLAGSLGLSLGFYIWYEPSMAHAAGFAFVTFFTAAALRWQERLKDGCGRRQVWRAAALMGLLLGVASMIRYTNLVFGIVPFALGLGSMRTVSARSPRSWAVILGGSLAAAAAGGLLGFFPQMIAWKILYGAWLTDSYQGEAMRAVPVHALAVLFSARSGLFTWTPLALLAVGGLLLAARRGDPLALGGLLAGLSLLWVYGSWEAWSLGASYGMRGFTDGSFYFMLGLAALPGRAGRAGEAVGVAPHGLGRRWLALLLPGLMTLLVAWNLYLVTCYRAGIQPPEASLASPARLLGRWPEWQAQFRKDYNLYKRLRGRHFPLFTPGDQGVH